MSDQTDDRFSFGRNWASFLGVLNEERIQEAERSLAQMIGRDQIDGSSFLDVGSGSGLFSLAAMRLGARRVHSFDYDADSVQCTHELRRLYFPDADNWTVEQGSALDADYLARLGQWNIVYAWGALHHTGSMWRALDLVTACVAPAGWLFVSIYNDQGPWSIGWSRIKRAYNRGPLRRLAIQSVFIPFWISRGLLVDVVRRKSPFARYRDYRNARGMSALHDWKDWLGGYPFEVAKPEQIFEFYRARGFVLVKLTTCAGTVGCNEFVFNRTESHS